ncbi:MAG: hypothetical protein A2X86_15540 [Bdellovibrionales bacterium GWA2_49_15]|nr:MAG: hypothetical protein A2X86_15540 [Bdellovibrionales bacterium GWA2_49_15]HAZ14543.1 hypothetical protein [Bdellovibrionales bacterium]
MKKILLLTLGILSLSLSAQTLEARPLPDPLYGVTIDRTDKLSKILDSLRRLSKRPTTRIVFDEFVAAREYQDAASAIFNVSYVMGELLDSFYVNKYSVADYEKRAQEYTSLLKDKVDLWEVGNEVNGEWLGATADVVAKVTRAAKVVKQSGGRTAMTLYYNPNCYEKPANEMFTWAEANINAELKGLLDYVLVSYYEDDCNGYVPNWQQVFDRLSKLFPGKKLGIGECGTTKKSKKKALVQRYYSMKVTTPNFIRGNFWWYFWQDMVPYRNSLWATLNETIRNN